MQNFKMIGMFLAAAAITGCGTEENDEGEVLVGECDFDTECVELTLGERTRCDLGNRLDPTDNHCVQCVAAETSDGRTIADGCHRGHECIENRCIEVEIAACSETTEAEDCSPAHPFCVLGRCVECETAEDCPFFGESLEDSCFAVRCDVGWCSAENVCDCESSAECNDGENCTVDVCSADTQECEHIPQGSCPTASGGGGGSGGSGSGGSGAMTITWTAPGTSFSSATMSAKVGAGPMTVLCSNSSAGSITCTITGLACSAVVDISVQASVSGTTRYSCEGASTFTPYGSLALTSSSATPTAPTAVSNGCTGAGGCNPGCNMRTNFVC